MRNILFTTILISLSTICVGQMKLPLFFGDSMVLQQQSQAAIWGTDNANTTIVVTGSWGNSSTTTSDITGKWKLQLQTPTAGGPFSVTIKGSKEIVFKDVLIGEVWLCAGQSNMEMPMKGYNTKPPQPVDSSDYFIANSTNNAIRVFKPGWNAVSRTPLSTVNSGHWNAANPTTTPDISATAYFFALKLQQTLNIPVAIIVVARGGSSIESWMDSATLATVKPVIIPDTLKWQDAYKTHVQMFNTMLYPFIGYTIRGAIWSQGEGNVSRSYEYQALCTKMINAWREKWHIGDFPFYIAQLVPAGAADNLNQVIMREAQLNTSLLTKNAGLAVLMDLFPSASVHYPQKKVVGDRLANLALVNNYQATGVAMGPVLKKFSINKNVINLTFNYAGTGLTAKDSLSNFEIAGADLVYYPAQATFADANFSINVTSVNVSNPLHVRYAFKNRVGASLYNKEGHPASSFRTETIATNFMLKETEKTRR